jgi:hypothetical protein
VLTAAVGGDRSIETRSVVGVPVLTASSQIDARWIGLDIHPPWNWQGVDQTVTRNFQQFGFRPNGETELPRGCNGCGELPSTMVLTVYAAGAFDPSDVSAGQPVTVNGAEGFYQLSDDAVLAWRYAENAWATLWGRTSKTSTLEALLDLAGRVRPFDRTPIRLPLRMDDVPEAMPLAAIDVNPGRYGATLSFAACAPAGYRAPAPECVNNVDSLRVQIWRATGYRGLIDETEAVAWTVGGTAGLYDRDSHRAAVQVQDGTLVVFELAGHGGRAPTTNLETILAGVVWAPDAGNDKTWQAVADWAVP